MALCDLHFKFEHSHHLSFQILSPPTRGEYWYHSFIEIMSIWNQMDGQQEGEIHAKLIGATHPISRFQSTHCWLLSLGPSRGKAHPACAQSTPALPSTKGITHSPNPAQRAPGERHKLPCVKADALPVGTRAGCFSLGFLIVLRKI